MSRSGTMASPRILPIGLSFEFQRVFVSLDV
jgi:hypothetical protein